MEIMEMIKLAKEGISASDVLALNKAGYTPEIIEELKNNGMQSEEVKQQAEQKQADAQEQQRQAEESKAETEALKAKLEEAEKQILTYKELIDTIQAGNRGSDMSGDLPDPDEYKKNLEKYIQSKM